jgi:CPA1 family monovalent cation:H+ antiporter
MVLALALPVGFPHRELLITLTFGVVVLSILLQGLTMGPLLRRLGIVGTKEEAADYGRAVARSVGTRAALGALEEMADSAGVPRTLSDKLRAEYHERLQSAEDEVARLRGQQSDGHGQMERGLRRSLLLAEKDSLLKAHHDGLIGSAALRPVTAEIDARLSQLDGAESD